MKRFLFPTVALCVLALTAAVPAEPQRYRRHGYQTANLPRCVIVPSWNSNWGVCAPIAGNCMQGPCWDFSESPPCISTVPATQPVTKVDHKTRDALFAALADERLAEATYAAAIAKFGAGRPLSNIIQAEQRHQALLTTLLERYSIAVPAKSDARIEAPATLKDAYTQAITLEKENVALYDKLLPEIQQDDIRTAMKQLRAASAERHLPALQRAASR